MERLDAARQLIADHFGVPLDAVRSEAHFVEDLGADSLDLLELTMQLEDAFGLSIEDDESETCQTVGEAYRVLSRKFQEVTHVSV